MLTEQEAAELLNEMYSMSIRFNELGWLDQASQVTRLRSKVSAVLHQRDEMRQKIDSLTTQLEEQLAKKNTVELMMPNMSGVNEVCDAVNAIRCVGKSLSAIGMPPYLHTWSGDLLKCAEKIEKFFGQPMVKMVKEMQAPHAGDKLDREIADAREDLMQASTNETWGWSARAQMATQFAAAMVGTIRDDMDYYRYRKIAERCGLPSVSAWIAAEANKQAGALLDELNR